MHSKVYREKMSHALNCMETFPQKPPLENKCIQFPNSMLRAIRFSQCDQKIFLRWKFCDGKTDSLREMEFAALPYQP